MMKNIKEKRQMLLNELQETNADFATGKRMIFSLFAVLIASRIIYIILDLVSYLANNVELNGSELSKMAAMLLSVLLFAFLIYSSGIKGFAYLALGGGLLSLFQAYQANVFFYFVNGTGMGTDPLLLTMAIFYMLSIFIQIAAMATISFHPKCDVYFKELTNVRNVVKKMIDEIRIQK